MHVYLAAINCLIEWPTTLQHYKANELGEYSYSGSHNFKTNIILKHISDRWHLQHFLSSSWEQFVWVSSPVQLSGVCAELELENVTDGLINSQCNSLRVRKSPLELMIQFQKGKTCGQTKPLLRNSHRLLWAILSKDVVQLRLPLPSEGCDTYPTWQVTPDLIHSWETWATFAIDMKPVCCYDKYLL